ncbi:F1F0 ATP synthase subunit D [Saccharomycopsis crataegensis]|uniref:ATP synthase subunit d, mitochondrial n=1 Tax=Saccharomycopsis crataegensis TaxID=43959 RepID=A0AAV5QJF3_9ASCO|nr:F1F0 ATP synthase subunit D [Saccharomycopsis crataegensis]
MSTRAAATKLDWSKLISTLGLKGKTASSLQAFKKRNDEARKVVFELSSQKTEVDFSHYKSVLKNQDIVRKIEADFGAFKPVTYDVSKQLNTIEAFKQKALENATATEEVVTKELKELAETLNNIESARAFEELTVEDVVKARPDIDDKVTQVVKKARWEVPGYYDKFGHLIVM